MALTNYLLQSVVCALWFYGFALGHWGMSRAAQVLFVALVFALQVARNEGVFQLQQRKLFIAALLSKSLGPCCIPRWRVAKADVPDLAGTHDIV